MKLVTIWIVVLVSMLAAAGCAATPEDRWYQQREALTAANEVYLASAPLMTAEQVVHHGELLQAARSSLEQAKGHLPDGGPAFDTALNVVEIILVRVAQQQVSEPANANPVSEDTLDDTR